MSLSDCVPGLLLCVRPPVPWLCSCGRVGHGCDCVTLAEVQADNELGVEGVKALAPVLAKLTQLQMLEMECECTACAVPMLMVCSLLACVHRLLVSHDTLVVTV